MKSKLTALLLAMTMIALCEPIIHAQAVQPTYELYSWQTHDQKWQFSLLPTTNRQKEMREILDAKKPLTGRGGLLQVLSHLPKNSSIVWIDRITFDGRPVTGSEILEIPTTEKVDLVRRYAKQHKLELSLPAPRAR